MDSKNISIEDERYKKFKKAYEYAIEQTKEEVDQSVEGMYHNLNSLQSRSGNQLPFTSINYGSSTEPEGRMVIKSLLENSIKGVGKGKCKIYVYAANGVRKTVSVTVN